MEFTALAPWKLIVLMAAGGIFSLAGLWLIFKPKTDGHSMVIHVAGMKLEASSAGVLVFLIGTAFFATPLFVRENTDPGGAATGHQSGGTGSAEAPVSGNAADNGRVQTNEARPQSVPTVSGRAITAVGNEVEPNNNIAEANEIEVGSLIYGEVAEGDWDFYSFTFPPAFVGTFTVNLNAPSGSGFAAYDELGGRMIQYSNTQLQTEIEEERYYIGVYTRDRRAGYSLSVAAREE